MCEFLTVKEAAERLRGSRSLIYSQIRSGKLKSYKVGAKTLLRAEDVDGLVVPVETKTVERVGEEMVPNG